MLKETHIIIDWTKFYSENEIRNYIFEFNLKIKTVINYPKIKNKEKVLSAFYNMKVNDFRGENDFLIYLIEDQKPVYDFRNTSKGIRIVNVKLFDLKQKLRKKTGGFKIHGTDNIQETKNNLKVLKLFTEHYDEKKYKTLQEVFKQLNSCKELKWVITHNFDNLQSDDDIDFLTNDYFLFINILDTIENPKGGVFNSITNGGNSVRNIITIDGTYKPIDIRFIGDNFYDSNFQKEILKSRIKKNDFHIPDKENYLFSFLYHSLMHKSRIPKKSITFFNNNNIYEKNLKSELDKFMKKNEYKYVKPLDESTKYNGKSIAENQNNLTFIKSSITKIKYQTFLSEVYISENKILKKGTDPICKNENKFLNILINYSFFPSPLTFKCGIEFDEILMEKIEGFKLLEIHEKFNFWSKKNIITIYNNAIDILIILTKEKIIHRDITPNNLIISENSNLFTLKLIDFGWSQNSNDKKSITPYGLGAGYNYNKGGFCDIYSMGKSLNTFSRFKTFKNINELLLDFTPICYENPENTIHKLNLIKNKLKVISKTPLLKDEIILFIKRNKIGSTIKKSIIYKFLRG